ncbi:unnamed protein product, partial [Mesorhabditis spiculigera]
MERAGRHSIRQNSGPTPLDSPGSSTVRSRASSCSSKARPSTSGNQPKLITVEAMREPPTFQAMARRRLSQPHSQSLDSALVTRSEAYRILEFLHCGNVDMGSDLKYLCQHRIRYLLNLTGEERMKIRVQTTCPCESKAFHSPTEFSVNLDEEKVAEIICSHFPAINRFVAEARAKGAHVLMFSRDGRNACQAMALQYIMYYHKMSLECAMRYFYTVYPEGVQIEENFMGALKLWEKKLENNPVDKRDIRSAEVRRHDWANVAGANRPMSLDTLR